MISSKSQLSAAGMENFEAVLARVPPDAPLAVAVSGGLDSVVLLHLLAAHRRGPLVVCHLDHLLRGMDSGADAAFVASLSASLGVECELAEEDVAARSKRERISIETAGRNARRDFFARICRRRAVQHIAIGHHADDRAETFLWNLLRGAGPRGLSAMPACAELFHGGPLALRPLLGFWRSEIAAHAAANDLLFRNDSSNCDPAFTRNRIRHEILPAIERVLDRPVRANLVRAAEVLEAENELLDGLISNALRDPGERLDVTEVRDLPVALQRRVIRGWLSACAVPECGFREIESIRGLLDAHPGKAAKVNLPSGCHARRRAGKLFIERT